MMKSLTTLAAAAALIAGMSIASAQNTAGPAPKGSSPSNLNAGSSTAGQSGSQSKGTAMKKSRTKKHMATGKAKFCMTAAPGGTNQLNCKYASMASCEKAAKPLNRNCEPNPNMGGTTGMKSGSSMKSGMKSNSKSKMQ